MYALLVMTLTARESQERNDLLHALAKRLAFDLTGSWECDCHDVTEGDGYYCKTCALHKIIEAFLQAHLYLS